MNVKFPPSSFLALERISSARPVRVDANYWWSSVYLWWTGRSRLILIGRGTDLPILVGSIFYASSGCAIARAATMQIRFLIIFNFNKA